MYKMIRAGSRYGVVILVTPVNAGPDTPDARYFELNSLRDTHPQRDPKWSVGQFNEIDRQTAMLGFSGMADGWGFAPRAHVHFPTLDDALQWVTKRREDPEAPFPAGRWFLLYDWPSHADDYQKRNAHKVALTEAKDEGSALHHAQVVFANVLKSYSEMLREYPPKNGGYPEPMTPQVVCELPWPSVTE